MKDWKETCWVSGNNEKVTIKDVLKRLENEPVVSIKISDIIRHPDVLIYEHKKDKADTAKFVILHNTLLLDGYHRVAKALERGDSHILAKVLKGNLFTLRKDSQS